MDIKKTVQDAINKQINAEFFSAYQYLAMAAYFKDLSLNGFANWMRQQANEEVEHGMKLYNFVLERSGKVELKQIAAPKGTWKSTLEVVQHALEHEKNVTQMIANLVELSRKEKDKSAEVMLDWFVNEQVEEEDNASDLVDQVKLCGEGHGLFILDRELANRKDE
jgi:ferritin